ncbi:MAG: hypothetical protein COV91_00180 [Candidatus Taylorbacteria bacterium CG11_big_fil_rev_8_21_14_0_20_46_11]|uniref:Type II toxin-antitoxin system antitoxin, RelB/DinJ family n=1 Tax=Candidatus Taylorbacteria bacterium CG11_big_fil_rev_8_21_14_0_20_46_11 TaxID=1975025 RepID=A0A2H0KD64_9BACT|nr:MAG: hypothetical protein COV91_00180 [Candidatus Taylorbacteria bacterium CG11_big_fil_rev_8_21_14_0_20_46_11]
MNTTLTIKTEKKLRNDAKRTADELGVPLTTVINALLRQFVREKELTLSAEPKPTKAKLALWEKISLEMDKRKGTLPSFTKVKELIADLKLTK